MYISSLRIDRFGVWSDLQLSAFAQGLNVLYGPSGAGKTTLVQFIRTTLYGFDHDVRRQYVNGDPRRLGGALTVQDQFGTHTIQRFDLGNQTGRLSVEQTDGTPVSPDRLPDLLGQVPSSVFDHVFLPGFHGATDVDSLMSDAFAQGFDLLGSPAELQSLRELQDKIQADRRLLAEVEAPEHSLPELKERRYRLQAELESLQSTWAEQREVQIRRLQELASDISELEERLERRQQELTALEADLTGREADKRRYEEALQATQRQQQQVTGERREQLQAVESQLERWRSVLLDIETRLHQLLAEDGITVAPAVNPDGDPRHFLRRLESRLEAILGSVQQSNRTPNSAACQCGSLRDTLETALPGLRDDIYGLCTELSHWQLGAHRTESANELTQLRRCETELRVAIQFLARRREIMQAAVTGQPRRDRSLREVGHGLLCECLDHPARVAVEPVEELEPALPAQVLAELTRELEQLIRRRQELQSEMETARHQLDELRDRRELLRSDAVRDAEQARLDSQPCELDRVLQQIRDREKFQQLSAAVTQGEAELRLREATVHDSTVLREAADVVRRLSNGGLQRIQLTHDRTVEVHNRAGDRLAYHQLTTSSREQVYFSLCLALVAAFARRGVRLPLILHDVLLSADPQGLAAAAQLLHDFGRRGHQVLLLTRHTPLVEALRALGVAVRDLPSYQQREVAAHVPAPAVADLSELKRLQANRELDALAAETATPAEPVADYRTWSSEEFPGELTDRVRLAKPPEPAPVAAALPRDDESAADYFLLECSPIQDAPSIDSATAERLRKIGVLQVRDLLRLKPETTADQLRYAGITASMIRRWQAEALLACRVARLRPYDARILVACGITDPDQLAQIEADELLRRVDEFAGTSLGQVLLRSGNRYELSRLADWIYAARRLYPGRHAHREQAAARPSAESPRPRTNRADQSSSTNPRRQDRGRETPHGAPQTPAEASPMVLKMEPTTADWRFHLEISDSVEAAPSIGPRMAERFTQIGVKSVSDFLREQPEVLAERLKHRRVTADTVRQWQQQTMLACCIPELRGHDAQVLVACGVTAAEQLAKMNAAELWQLVESLIASPDGKRLLRGGKTPDLAEIGDWIRWAAHARKLRAA